MKVAIN